MATLRQRGENWQAIIRKKGHRHLARTFKDEATAREWADDLEQNIDALVERKQGRLYAPVVLDEYLIPESEYASLLWARIQKNARGRAQKKGLACTLTRLEFDALLNRAGGRCEVTGIPFNSWCPDADKAEKRFPFFPSVDRIDSRKGYTANNVRLVCYIANLCMSHWGATALHMMVDALICHGWEGAA